jgi:hypothetical protein
MTGQPTLRDRAIDATAQALNTGQYWLPTEAQSAETHPDVPELADAHNGIAAGLHIGAAHIARGHPALVARLKQQIDQPDLDATA